jgi:hypothetical protein
MLLVDPLNLKPKCKYYKMNYWQHKWDGQKYRVEDILSQIESATNKVRGVLLGEPSTSIYVITT